MVPIQIQRWRSGCLSVLQSWKRFFFCCTVWRQTRVADSRHDFFSSWMSTKSDFSYSLSLRVHGALLLQAGSTMQQSENKCLLLLMRFIDKGTFLCSLLIIICFIISESSSKTRWSVVGVYLSYGSYNKKIFSGKAKSRSFLLSCICYFSSTKHTSCTDTTELWMYIPTFKIKKTKNQGKNIAMVSLRWYRDFFPFCISKVLKIYILFLWFFKITFLNIERIQMGKIIVIIL